VAHHYIVDEVYSLATGERITLSGAEGRHAASVSRVRVGEHLSITNGRGLLAQVTVESVGKVDVELLVDSVAEMEPQRPAIALVQALAKGDRDERAIEAATELGVTSVIPWQASRSVSRWDADKATKGVARWQTIVREASKQSIRSWIPAVAELASTKDVCDLAASSSVLVLAPEGDSQLADIEFVPGREVIIVVGPEGGITPEELGQFRAAGAHLVSLGANILRTSTAGVAAIAALNQILERW